MGVLLLCFVRQVALFSATMPLDVLEVTNRFMPDPVRILVKKDELTLEGEPVVNVPCEQLWGFDFEALGFRGMCLVLLVALQIVTKQFLIPCGLSDNKPAL